MKSEARVMLVALLCGWASACLQAPAWCQAGEAEKNAEKGGWFREAKFGFIVHYSLFSLAPWEGCDPLALNVRMRSGEYPLAEYEALAGEFRASKFDAPALLGAFKAAGARYVTVLSKEHDGFCLFDSALTDYDAWRTAGRDIIREYVEAARATGMRICLYYSMLDEHHPEYRANLPAYVDYMHAQIRELCTRYGAIDGIWFDGEWDHPLEAWRSPELVALIHELAPLTLVNDRLGLGQRGKTELADFFTREQPDEIDKPMDFERRAATPWEACMTIGDSWVYSKKDTNLKSVAEVLRRIVAIAGRGGNILLNMGLTADGEIPAEFRPYLEAIGQWMAVNGESIYGTCGSPLKLDAATSTVKGNRLYVHLTQHPGAPLALPGLKNAIQRAWLLQGGEELAVNAEAKTIALPATLPDAAVTTVAIELEGALRTE